jgi:hypothetical protein
MSDRQGTSQAKKDGAAPPLDRATETHHANDHGKEPRYRTEDRQPDSGYSRATLIESSTSGYIHVTAEVSPA